ncbi:hypothetical protein GPECTOR_1668g794 [Gonium pectorale]|uniref:Ubiquitin-like protease family profile domain-containing protein n=1 Tax=Gonium pectorale TaxID=33097 RepID=A0A150FTC3_GONPE|nr:hypothetical protein GPECTOR_1668g794 [Gonium pectorale]|eukprot:KXZ40873.1 hypothetical protein GPECTOR_1668g794 [Gonium pectorale]
MLTDNTINAYVLALRKEATRMRMGTEDNLHVIGAPVTRMLDAELVLVPIDFADLEHWALAGINMRQRKITFYDSIAAGGAP